MQQKFCAGRHVVNSAAGVDCKTDNDPHVQLISLSAAATIIAGRVVMQSAVTHTAAAELHYSCRSSELSSIALQLQVKAARGLKRLLTGKLSSLVSSYPVFPGTEANYLRAQVSCWQLE